MDTASQEQALKWLQQGGHGTRSAPSYPYDTWLEQPLPGTVCVYLQSDIKVDIDQSEGTQPLITNDPPASSATGQPDEMVDSSEDKYQIFQTGATVGCDGRPCKACSQQQDHSEKRLYLLGLSYDRPTTIVLTSSYKCGQCSGGATVSVEVQTPKHSH